MAFSLGDAVRAVRLRHPAFADPSIVPTVTLAAEANRLQRSLVEAATLAYSGTVAHSVPIYLAIGQANLPGVVAAGSTGGLPVRSRSVPLDATAGFATHFELDDAEEILGPFVGTVVVGATDTVVTLTGAGRVVDGDVAYYLQIVDGPGAGPDAIRSVDSNGVDSWTVENFRVSPDATSVFRLIAVVEQEMDTDATAITQVASTRQQSAYLMKLDAQGQPYLDLTTPLVATLREGVPLPPHYMLLGLEMPRTTPSSFPQNPAVLPVTRQPEIVQIPIYQGTQRNMCGRFGLYAFVEGDRLYLGGDDRSWARIPSLTLTFVPIPDVNHFDTTSRLVLETLFLLPDSASEALTAGLALTAARQAAARNKVDRQAVVDAQAEADGQTGLWLRSLKRRVGALARQGVRNR